MSTEAMALQMPETSDAGPNIWGGSITPQRLLGLARLVCPAEGMRGEIAVHAPFTAEEIGAVPACTEADLLRAVARAREAQRSWGERPFSERRGVLLRFHDLVLKRQEELLDIIQMECGKARHHAFEEVLDVAMVSRHYAVHGRDYLRPRRRKGALPLLTLTREYRHPVGVVGIISPWNYPLSLAVSDALPALLAGNAVLLKPDPQTSFTALLGVELLLKAGLPAGLVQIVTGDGRFLGAPLIAAVDAVSFTGSTATGRIIAKQAGRRLVKCSLELGGKNPMLVLDDADIDAAVEGAVRGCFANAGQLCMSCERLYVQSGIHDRFLDAFAARTRSLRLGGALDYRFELGSLTSARQLATVTEHLADAVARGARVLAGGRPRPDLGPFFFEPTILADVTREMTVAREETFGPVVSVYRFDDPEEAVREANDSPYGLNASIWSRNTRLARALAARIRCGTVNINEGYAAAWGSVAAPMGGMKVSGLGRRHGAGGILRFTEAQTVAVQRLIPLAPPAGMKPQFYASLMTGALVLLRRIPGLR